MGSTALTDLRADDLLAAIHLFEGELRECADPAPLPDTLDAHLRRYRRAAHLHFALGEHYRALPIVTLKAACDAACDAFAQALEARLGAGERPDTLLTIYLFSGRVEEAARYIADGGPPGDAPVRDAALLVLDAHSAWREAAEPDEETRRWKRRLAHRYDRTLDNRPVGQGTRR